ncbi:ATP-grasp domain-containing protein [Methylosinus sporium]|uniref:ATP-grasp domain-containing protein n=1 Tax=Methylosinus sporium TaxID=428 RepID=UPI00132FE09B|nr:ATP-grasp domain-containing protein [Methylosinus sporium]
MEMCLGRPAVIVDPYSSGAFFAEAFQRVGVPVVAVMSAPEPPEVYASSFRPQDFAQILVADGPDLTPLVDELIALDPRCILAGCESGVELTDRVAPLVLPELANIPEKAMARRHKGAMAQAVADAGIPSMRQICTDSVDEVASWLEQEGLIGEDLVIKPPKSASTDGVIKIIGGRDWREHFMTMLGSHNRLGIHNDRLMVQELLRGTEYAVDTATFRGCHTISSICRYNKVDNGPFMAIYDSMDWMPVEFPHADELKEYAGLVLDAVGVMYGTSHVEIMLTENGPRLVEIGARPHGGGHPRFCRLATGDSQVDLIARSFVANRPLHADYSLKTNVTVVFFLCRRSGVVRNRAALDRVVELASHHFSRIDIKQGDHLEPTKDLFASLAMGFIVLSHDDPGQIVDDYRAIRELEESLFD